MQFLSAQIVLWLYHKMQITLSRYFQVGLAFPAGFLCALLCLSLLLRWKTLSSSVREDLPPAEDAGAYGTHASLREATGKEILEESAVVQRSRRPAATQRHQARVRAENDVALYSAQV